MEQMRRVRQYLLTEPFTWLFYCIFQPARFTREVEIRDLSKRIVSMLRLALPLFLISYPFVLLMRIGLCQVFPGLALACFSIMGTFVLPSLMSFLIATTWAIVTSVAIAILCGTVGGIAIGIVFAITSGIALGIGWGIVGDVAFTAAWGIAFGIEGGILSFIARSKGKGIKLALTRRIILGIILNLTLAIVLYIKGNIKVGIAGAIVLGISAGLVGGVALGTVASIMMFLAEGISAGIVGSIAGGIQIGLATALTFTISYLLGYYRLPLYPVSGLSAFKAYLASRKNPLQVFRYLHRSSLYWDERVFLPLPGLKRMLLIAAEQNEEQALEEIAFIVAERPQQLAAARSASLEIAIHDLEMRDSLHEIARASQRLAEILPQDAGLIDPRWVQPFVRLNDASRDAARYCSPLGWQARRDALEDMLTNLKRVYPNVAFHDATLNKRLGQVVNLWQLAARHELAVLEKALDKIGQIDNPYNPGQALKLRDSLFVGRHDLVQQLEEALNRGSRRPTFLLNGERRMGKSSTLKQLPNLLGARYLPIVYDLQNRGISSSTAAFLGTIAEEIYKVMSARGMKVKKLEYARLREASRENEAAVYHLFEQWFRDMEHTLEQEDRTLLLLFDEFEKLEEAEQDGYLNLRLLLDWFRSVIQNHPRLALLFSGVRSFGEMGMNWAGYFVNVQTLRVSFLRPAEARQLITRPIPHFPSEQIYGEGLVEEIMRVTGCHPFLVQAVCSALIEHLNAGGRGRAEMPYVRRAVDQVLENWWDTYFRDLWERATQDERACLVALRKLNQGNLHEIALQCGLNEKTARNVLQILFKRDLVLLENGSYRIATPIFSEWIERIC